VSDPPFIKICGITSEADALLAVGLGADALGFVLAPSPRQLSPSAVADIVKRVPHGVLTVGVFRDEAPQRVVEIANHAGLGAVQLHGHETAESCRWVRQRVSCSIKAFSAGDRTIARFGEFSADFLLVSGGLTANNVGQAIAHLHPFGVDVSSGVESEPGRKDPLRLREFVVAARAAAAELAPLPDGPAGAVTEDEEPYDWMDG
jgi:phosphoribosylanthranilate isomerase